MGLLESSGRKQPVYLSPSEYKKLKIQAGWNAQTPPQFVFDVINPLAFAIFCPVVQVTEKSGKVTMLELRPKLFLPIDANRKSSAGVFDKALVKDYVLVCTRDS